MIRWVDEGTRVVAMCGEAKVGAVFPGTRVRWRAWVTDSMSPIESKARDVETAKEQVEKRFAEFCALAKLQPIPEAT